MNRRRIKATTAALMLTVATAQYAISTMSSGAQRHNTDRLDGLVSLIRGEGTTRRAVALYETGIIAGTASLSLAIGCRMLRKRD